MFFSTVLFVKSPFLHILYLWLLKMVMSLEAWFNEKGDILFRSVRSVVVGRGVLAVSVEILEYLYAVTTMVIDSNKSDMIWVYNAQQQIYGDVNKPKS